MVTMASLVPNSDWITCCSRRLFFFSFFFLLPLSTPTTSPLEAIGVNLGGNCSNYFLTVPADSRVYRKTALDFTERVEKHLMALRNRRSVVSACDITLEDGGHTGPGSSPCPFP